jgi:hypothetical protein
MGRRVSGNKSGLMFASFTVFAGACFSGCAQNAAPKSPASRNTARPACDPACVKVVARVLLSTLGPRLSAAMRKKLAKCGGPLPVGSAAKPAGAKWKASLDEDKTQKPSSRVARMSADDYCYVIARKNKKCIDALLQFFMGDVANLPAEAKRKLALQLKENITGKQFITECLKNWDSKKRDDIEVKEKLVRCLRHDQCRDYAQCLKKAMSE